MIVHEWAIRALFLLLSLHTAYPEPTFNSCGDFDYSDNSGPIPPPPNINFSSPPCGVRILPIKPVRPPSTPLPQPPPVPCNNTVNGNNLYLVVDPQTKMLSIQITPPCKSSDDHRRYRRDDPGTGTCSLITLITQIINSLLDLVSNVVTSILTSVNQLLQNLLTTLLGPLLSDLAIDIEVLLNTTLTEVETGLTSVVQTTGLIGNQATSPLAGLLTAVGELLGGVLGPANPVTANVNQLLNNTFAPILANVQTLILTLLDPSEGLVSELTDSLVAEINTTLVGVLNDVDKLVTNLFDDLLGNGSVFTVNGTLAGNGNQSLLSPLISNFTKNVEILLTDVLNDTICDVEKLLNDTGSLAAVVADLQKLVDDLLADILLGVGKLVDDTLTNALGEGGLLDNLIQNIEKLLTDALINLLNEKINLVRNSTLLTPGYQANLLENLLTDLDRSLLGSVVSTVPGAPALPLPISPAPQILDRVNNTLNGLVNGLQNLLTGLQSNATTSLVVTGPVTTITQALDTLLQSLIDALLGKVNTAVSGQLGNITGLINLPAITSPIGTTVTGLLKSVLGCNLTCNEGSGNSTDPPSTLPPITDPPSTLTPITVPPITLPPIIVPPIPVPPIIIQLCMGLPTTLPPTTVPPTTVSPTTVPPTTVPPTTVPPTTVPLTTVPPTTVPPTTVPPTTKPPTIFPPITVPPITKPSITLPPITSPATPSTNRPPQCDPSCFLSLLNQYQQAVVPSICGSLNANSDPCNFISSQLDRELPYARADDYDYGDFDELPNRLLGGLDKTVQLTNGLATNGLVNLVSTASQNAKASDSVALPIL